MVGKLWLESLQVSQIVPRATAGRGPHVTIIGIFGAYRFA